MAIKKGGKTLTAREQKRAVMEWKGWTSSQYNKEYDKLRNRARNYERAIGAKKGTINVADLLARDARNEYYNRTKGIERRTPADLKAIQRTTSASTGKKLSIKTAARVQAFAVEALRKEYSSLLQKTAKGEYKSKTVAAALGKLSKDATVADVREALRGAGREINEQRRAIAEYNRAADVFHKKRYES